jgi:hypothetical protein
MSQNSNDYFVSPRQGPPSLPEVGQNNLWFQDRKTDEVLVFVHGIFSDSRSCWLRTDPLSVYWPDLVSRDCRFNRYSIYLGGYYTALDAGAFKVQHCADELFRALARPDRPGARSVLQRTSIVFICHSTGGIVVRYLLESRAATFKEKTVGLVLIASPSFGSAWASTLSWLSSFYNAQLARQLEWGNNSLDDLDERFHRLIKERRIPHLIGAEAYENHFIFHRKLLPDRLVVVDKNSAGRYFAPAHLLARTDHFTSVKPDSERHPAHSLLVDFSSQLDEYQRLSVIISASDHTSTARSYDLTDVGSVVAPRSANGSENVDLATSTQSSKTVVIFFFGLGDAQLEIGRLMDIIDEMSLSFARHSITLRSWAFEVDPMSKSTTQGGSTPVIAEQFSCGRDGSIPYDLFVGIMGRPTVSLPNRGSGIAHEFLEAMKSFEANGTPHVLFYFDAKEPDANSLDNQINEVLRFRTQFPGLCATYTSAEDLDAQFRRHLLTELLDLLHPNASQSHDPIQDNSWDQGVAAFDRIHVGYSPTFLDNSAARVGRILRQLNLLFGSERRLRSPERRVLIGSIMSLFLKESDRRLFELSAGWSTEEAAGIRDAVNRSLDPSRLILRSMGSVRLDLIGAFLIIGMRLDLSRRTIAFAADTIVPLAETSDEWLAFLTDDIICGRGIVRFHLLAPSMDWVDPLKCAAAVGLEVIWQRTRTVLTRHGFSFAVSQSRVELAADVGIPPREAFDLITRSAQQALESLPTLPHFGQTKLPPLEALLPLPLSKVRRPVAFRAPMPGSVRLLVDGIVTAEEADSGAITYYPPPGNAVVCVLECDEAGEFIPLIESHLQRVSPIEAGILDSALSSLDAMRLCGLWNDLLESAWPAVSVPDPDRELSAIAYHILRDAFEELSSATGSMLARRDIFWDAMENIRGQLEDFIPQR